MTQRPWPIVLIAVFHILAPFINLYMSADLLSMPLSDYIQLQLRHDWFYLVVWILLPLFAGIALLTFRMWSYYAFLGFISLVALYTLRQRLLYPYRVSYELFMFLELINFLVILYFLSPPVKRIYLNKRIRWWQQKPRYVVDWPCLLGRASQTFSAKIENISEGGAYVTMTEALKDKESVVLAFEFDGKQIQIPSLVLHHKGAGYGLLFDPTLRPRQELKLILKTLAQKNIPVRGRTLSLQESFLIWFKELLSTGHGLFPEDERPSGRKRN